jgi:hypothetical protein
LTVTGIVSSTVSTLNRRIVVVGDDFLRGGDVLSRKIKTVMRLDVFSFDSSGKARFYF